MGCHTWMFNKVYPQPTEQEVRQNVISQLDDEFNFAVRIAFGDLPKELREAYPEWNDKEYGYHLAELSRRRIRMISKGLCSKAIYNWYETETLGHFFDGIWYENTEFHDAFRRREYPDDTLHSLEESLEYINNPENECTVYESTIERLTAFWNKYPEGIIYFG